MTWATSGVAASGSALTCIAGDALHVLAQPHSTMPLKRWEHDWKVVSPEEGVCFRHSDQPSLRRCEKIDFSEIFPSFSEGIRMGFFDFRIFSHLLRDLGLSSLEKAGLFSSVPPGRKAANFRKALGLAAQRRRSPGTRQGSLRRTCLERLRFTLPFQTNLKELTAAGQQAQRANAQ